MTLIRLAPRKPWISTGLYTSSWLREGFNLFLNQVVCCSWYKTLPQELIELNDYVRVRACSIYQVAPFAIKTNEGHYHLIFATLNITVMDFLISYRY